MSESRVREFGPILVVVVVALLLVLYMYRESSYVPRSLADGVIGYKNGKIFDITLTNGTHVIQSYVVIDNDSNEVVEQDHYLIKIDPFTLIGQYETLKNIPNYETFL